MFVKNNNLLYMKIIIIGDVLLDINYYCNTTRTAPEANIPVYNVLETEYLLGGAANVAKNMKNLECDVEFISVIGDDNVSSIVKDKLDEYQIKHQLFVDKSRKTTQKNRIFHDEKLITRYDIEDTQYIRQEIENEIIQYIINKNKDKPEAIVFSDYSKGVLTQRLCKTIIDYANRNNILTFVDPKPCHVTKYINCFCIKLNLSEGEMISVSKSKREILYTIKENLKCNHVILTCAEHGMYINTIENHIYHKTKINVKDVTGCGDVVLSVIAYMYLQNKNMMESAKIANYIAGKAVQYIGNYSISKSDLYEYIDTVIYDNEYEKIINIRNIYKNIVFTNGCFDLIHSAHIGILQFSKKQGDILVVGINSDNSVKTLKGNTRPINTIIERCELLKNLGFIDYIIVFDDTTPYRILELLRPDIIVKGGDYTKENIIGKEFTKEIILYHYMNGISSTNTIENIKRVFN